ncbi:MAG: AMP-binding protein, partial [Acetobacteraceae bacterium]|nr:AMP-binding protein [Acetobacteraceae bacterium]
MSRHDRFLPAGAAHKPHDPPPTLNAALRRAAARRPDHPALIFYGAEIGYAELLARVERLAAFLQHRCGLRRGDRVLLDMQNSPHFVIAYHGVLRAGGVVVPLSPMSVTEELAFYAEDSGARIALA